MIENIDWVLIGLLGAVGAALFNVSQKIILDDNEDSFTVAFHGQLYAIIFLLPISVWFFTSLPSVDQVFFILISGLFNALSFYLLAKALSLQAVSIIAPIRAIVPISVAIIEPLVLPATYSIPIGIAAVCASFGIYVLLVEDDLASPFKNIRTKGVQYALLSALCIVLPALLDRYIIVELGVSPFILPLYLIISVVLFLLLFGYFHPKFDGVRIDKQFIPVGFGRALLLGSALFGFSLTTSTNINILIQFGIILSVLAGGKILKESYILLRIAGAILIITAVIIVALFG